MKAALPTPARPACDEGVDGLKSWEAQPDYYTADQMHAYAAEALRQSQSLPAGAVAWQWRYGEDPGMWVNCSHRVFAEMSEHPDLYETRALIPATSHPEQALQADAREKGEAFTALWRPIESAPKDESSIILWDEDHGAGVCLWDKELQKWIKWWHPYDGPQYAAKATHWMPLPHDPTTHPAQASEAVSDAVMSKAWRNQYVNERTPCKPDIFAATYEPAEALRQSQSLPAGAVAGLVGKWREEAEKLRRCGGRAQRRGDLPDADVSFTAAQDACAYADELEQALQADAREKGEAVVRLYPEELARMTHGPSLRLDEEDRLRSIYGDIAIPLYLHSGDYTEAMLLLEKQRELVENLRGQLDDARADATDGCTEANCERCNTAIHSRGDMRHAGIGTYPATQPAQASEAMDGVSLIAAERQRQVTSEGFSTGRDDCYLDDELARAAACYALPEKARPYDYDRGYQRPSWWPAGWFIEWWKPTPNERIRELAKAGALIAAEIDRLQRAALATSSQETASE